MCIGFEAVVFPFWPIGGSTADGGVVGFIWALQSWQVRVDAVEVTWKNVQSVVNFLDVVQ